MDKNRVVLTVHRGTNQVGGSCVEIATATTKILIDIGLPLDSKINCSEDLKQYLPPIEGFIDAVFISHYHLDHHGLLSVIDSSIPVFASAATEKMFKINEAFLKKPQVKNLRIIEAKTPVMIGDIRVTAYIVDHSAYDAMAFLIEADGKRILYSGDIRMHGVKESLYKNLPQDVDYLILEGTNMGNPECRNETELAVCTRFADLFLKYPDRINYVWCAGQNIDRLVQIYKACLKMGKIFVPDVYVANVLREIHEINKNIPSAASHRDIRVWFTPKEMPEHRCFFYRMNPFKIKSSEIRQSPEKYVVIIRPSLLKYIKQIDASQANLITSIWKNYKIREENRPLYDWAYSKGYEEHAVHTSGHADVHGLKMIVKYVCPKLIIPIHTQYKASYSKLFSNVVELNDGEKFVI